MSSPTLLAGQNPTTPSCVQQTFPDDPLQQLQGVRVERSGGRAQHRMGQDGRVQAVELPGREERRPVDPLDELLERVVGDGLHSQEGRSRRHDVRPVDGQAMAARLGDGVPRDLLLPGAALAPERLVLLADARRERRPPVHVDERGRDADGA